MASRGRKANPTPGPFASVEAGEPKMPAFLKGDKVAVAEWKRAVQLLLGRRTLSEADLAVLASYCSAFSTVARCRAELAQAASYSISTAAGGLKPHPLLGVLSGAERSLVSFATELGMTPTARARAAVIEPAGGDDLDAFLADGSA